MFTNNFLPFIEGIYGCWSPCLVRSCQEWFNNLKERMSDTHNTKGASWGAKGAIWTICYFDSSDRAI